MIKIISKLWLKNKEKGLHFLDEPKILFGRYSDRNKSKEQYDSWDKALSLYKEKAYIESFNEFFNYLKDKDIENVQYIKEDSKISFTIIQGSKIVTGMINNREVQAEAELVRFDKLEVPVMRKLLQQNYFLYSSKFAIKNDIFTLKYFSPIEDAHPSSLYYALKELATEADMYDDVLVEEFDSLHPINIEHVEQIPESEKQIKLKYFRIWIDDTLKRIKTLDSDKLTGSISYNLLNLAFKIYYLLAPEGKLLDDIRYIQGIFYEDDEDTLKEKNYRMIEEFKIQQEKADSEILRSFYKIKATFGVASPTSHEQLVNFMQSELDKLKWYIENNHPEVVRQMCEYIISYSCFTFEIPAIANDLMMVSWRIFNPEIFTDLGFSDQFYNNEQQKFNEELIKKKINAIVKFYRKRHPNIQFNPDNLNFENLNQFAISFINEFQNLNYD